MTIEALAFSKAQLEHASSGSKLEWVAFNDIGSAGDMLIFFDYKPRLVDSSQLWFWTREWQAGERKVDEHYRKGEFEEFESLDEMYASRGLI